MHVYPERTQLGFQNVILHDGFVHYARRRERDFGLIDDYLPWLRQRAGADADYFDHGVNCNSVVARPWDKPEALHPTNWVVTQAIDFLRRRDPRKPFLLYLSFHRPHPPYDPPAWAFEQFLDAPMPDPPVGDWADLYAPYAQPFDPQSPVGAAPRGRCAGRGPATTGWRGAACCPPPGAGAGPRRRAGGRTCTASTPPWDRRCTGSPTGTRSTSGSSGAGREQLFDLDADPQERHDLARPGAGAGAAGCARWRDVLTQALAGRPEGFVRDGRLVPGRPVRALLTE